MSHLRVTIPLLFLTASAVFAQAEKSAAPRSIDVERSTITVHVYRSGLFSFAGDNHEVRAPIASGTVDEGARTVEFTVDARRLQVLDPHLSAAKRSQVQKKMLSPDVLDPDRYREIKFRSSSVEQKNNGEMLVHGPLTLHGQTRPIVVSVSGKQHHYRGSATLKQTDFGMKPIRIAGGSVKVKDELKIDFDILLVLSSIAVVAPSTVSLDSGFQLLYNLDFRGAQEHFAGYQKQHAADPMGPVAEAAGLLFSEFNRLGILSMRFLARDSAFQSRPALKPDAVIYHRFDSALQRAEALARPRLARDPNDRNALLAMTLVNGLRADYSALIENSKLGALHYARDGTNYAHRLLAICPDCYDAYIATGISRYLIGSMAAPVRWMLRLGGFSSDKRQGMAELQLVSERGHYLAAYARILLAIAYIREKNLSSARQLLVRLRDEYPGNDLFSQELARLDKKGH